MSLHAYLSLGSNIGNRGEYLEKAREALRNHAGITVLQASSIYETEPLFKDDGDTWFLNQALEIKTTLSPEDLLGAAQEIEKALGRVGAGHHRGPRTIDIDILLYGDRKIIAAALTVPHPRLMERRCILTPLAEIHPEFQKILSDCPDTSKVKPL